MIDEVYMRLALRLATKGLGWTGANPMVGAVVVKDDQVIAQGYHETIGGPHAEVQALMAAGSGARRACLYVTLEPCVHEKKRTPPCVPRIIESGIARVVIAMTDPNPAVAGGGITRIAQAGIEVREGILARHAARLNVPYTKFITSGRPFVTLKAASTLDGKIAAAAGQSRWITSVPARRYVHRLRSRVDAVVVGIGTVLADNPELTVRLPGRARHQPHRVIVDSTLRVPCDAKALAKSPGVRVIVATPNADGEHKRRLEEQGVEILTVDVDPHGRVLLTSLMDRLGQLGFAHVMIEGGARINASALEAGIVDRVLLMMSPVLLGGRDARSLFEGQRPVALAEGIPLDHLRIRRIGPDVLIEGRPRPLV